MAHTMQSECMMHGRLSFLVRRLMPQRWWDAWGPHFTWVFTDTDIKHDLSRASQILLLPSLFFQVSIDLAVYLRYRGGLEQVRFYVQPPAVAFNLPNTLVDLECPLKSSPITETRISPLIVNVLATCYGSLHNLHRVYPSANIRRPCGEPGRRSPNRWSLPVRSVASHISVPSTAQTTRPHSQWKYICIRRDCYDTRDWDDGKNWIFLGRDDGFLVERERFGRDGRFKKSGSIVAQGVPHIVVTYYKVGGTVKSYTKGGDALNL